MIATLVIFAQALSLGGVETVGILPGFVGRGALTPSETLHSAC